jgi:hypothetical protein
MFHMLSMMLPSPYLDDVVVGHVSRIPFLLRGIAETSKNIIIIFELLSYRSNLLF